MTTTTNFASLKDVSTALSSIGFQVSQETLGAISRNCRKQFLERLSLAVSGQDQEGSNKKFISNLLRCLSPDVLKRATQVAPDATVDSIVPIAIAMPVRFMSALDVALDAASERHASAKEWVTQALAGNLSAHGAQPPTPPGVRQPSPSQPPSPPASRQFGAPPQGRQHRPEEPPPPSSPSRQLHEPANYTPPPPSNQDNPTQRTFESVHVYGANAALCFNANKHNDKHGIMVDAAQQVGPRSYDWKNATHVWLDINEVGACLAVLRRWRKGIELSAHGAQNDKSFSLEFQGTHFFARVAVKKSANGGAVRAVKILPTDATAVCILFLKQLGAEYPTIPLNELLNTVRATHQIENAAAA